MSNTNEIAKIADQEKRLCLPSFDEATAFSIGAALRERGLREKFGIIVDIRTWDRPLFYCALPGSTSNNTEWARRKINVVKLFLKSSYRVMLEQGGNALLGDNYGLPARDYVLSGGGFPISVQGAGVVGAIAVSGLAQRQDHAIIVDALCDHLGIDRNALALD